MQSIYAQNIMTILRHRDKCGRRVSVTRPGVWNPDKIKFPDLFCAVFQLHEMISGEEKTQIAGCTSIIDAKNFGFKQLRNLALEDIRVVVNFIQVIQSFIATLPNILHITYNIIAIQIYYFRKFLLLGRFSIMVSSNSYNECAESLQHVI